MRRELLYLIYSNVVLFLIAIYVTFDLLTLSIDDTSEDALLDSEINISNKELRKKQQLIPKILHQTYKTENIPEHWKAGQQKCQNLHPDYDYIMWTDEMALNFIKEHFAWFLPTFEHYEYPIQRADAIRYFILYKYGGIYIDLDDGCERKLDPLLTVPAFVRKTSPTGISNDVMGAMPGHPFYLKLMHSLEKYNRNWIVPYITILSSTGPLFVSLVWKQYTRWGVPENGEVRILQPEDYKLHDNSFFSISKGSSWHTGDAVFVKSLASHILSCVVAGFVFSFFCLYIEYCIYCKLCEYNNNNSASQNNNLQPSKLTQLFRKLQNWYSTGNTLPRYGDLRVSSHYKHIDMNNVTIEMKRMRKNSNLPFLNKMEAIKENDPSFTDLTDS